MNLLRSGSDFSLIARMPGRALAASLLLSGLLPLAARADLAEGIAAFEKLDYPTAIAEMNTAVAAGDKRAHYFLGLMRDPAFHRLPSGQYYQYDFFDVGEAVRQYKIAIGLNDPFAMHRLAELYLLLANDTWPGYEDDDVGNYTSIAISLRRQAMPLLRARQEVGDGVSAYFLAEARRNEPFFFSSLDSARKLLEAGARKNVAVYQLYLGKTYLFVHGRPSQGSGFSYDPVEAFAWFTVAAKAGNHHASVYQVEAAEAMPIRDHERAENTARSLLKSLATANIAETRDSSEEK